MVKGGNTVKNKFYKVLGDISAGAIIVAMTFGGLGLAIKALLWVIGLLEGAF